MTRRSYSRAAVLCLSLSLFVLYGCGAGYRISNRNGHESVYYVDGEGNKTLVYEVAKDGTVTIHDENDPKAQQLMKTQEMMEVSEAADLARIERIKEAPKRSANDPIRVVFYQPELGPKLKEAQHSEGAVAEEIFKHFQSDDVIQLVSGRGEQHNELMKAVKMYQGKSTNEAPASDVEVYTTGHLEERVGINKKTGKLGSMWVVVFEATIVSNYLPAQYTVQEEGNVFRGDVVSERFANEIKAVIKNDIGPTIPVDRSM
jgi:hypothetical protein